MFALGLLTWVYGRDVQKVKDQIANGVWIVIHTGWSKFYEGAPPKNPFLSWAAILR